MIELKKCPFCGGKAEMYFVDRYGYRPICPDCECDLGYFNSEEEGVEAWNRRVDEKPVVHGEWKRERLGISCSVCGREFLGLPMTTNYCPNCGADMRELRELRELGE